MWKSSKRYMKDMRSLLYRKDKESRRFLAALEGDIEEYLRLNPAATYVELVSEFGDPANNIKEYYLMRGEKFVIKTVVFLYLHPIEKINLKIFSFSVIITIPLQIQTLLDLSYIHYYQYPKIYINCLLINLLLHFLYCFYHLKKRLQH